MRFQFAPTRCLYLIHLPGSRERPVGPRTETLFAHVDRLLVAVTDALRVIATLPVEIHQPLHSSGFSRLPSAITPRHAIFLSFEETSGEAEEWIAKYPFALVLETSPSAHEFRAGHVRLPLLAVDVAPKVLAAWRYSCRDAVERVRSQWPEEAMDLVDPYVDDIESGYNVAQDDPRLLYRQRCLQPNGIVRNLAAGYWGETSSQVGEESIDPSNTSEIWAGQTRLATEVRSLVKQRSEGPTAIITVPSINPAYVRRLHKAAAKAGAPEGMIDSLLRTSGYIFKNEHKSEMSREARLIGSDLAMERQSEVNVYDAIATLAASPRHDVAFRTAHIPDRLFEKLRDLAEMSWETRKIPRTVRRWEEYGAKLAARMGEPLLQWSSRNARRIRAFSDLPIEWAHVDGVPLHYHLPIHRIPLAPGNAPMRSVVDVRPPTYWGSVSEVRVLIAIGHHTSDPVGAYWPTVATIAEELGFPSRRCVINSDKDLFDELESFRPNVLFLSSHGILDRDGARLALPFGESDLRSELPFIPDAAVVSACRSDPVVNTYGSPASNLYLAGVRSVLGSYLKLTEPHATYVAVRLLANLHASLTGDDARNTWGDIVWWTLRSSRPVDILLAAQSYAKRHGRGSDDYMALFGAFAQIHNGTNGRIAWNDVGSVLCRLAHGTSLAYGIDAVVQQQMYRPESMYYTHIGEPDRILVGPRWRDLAPFFG